MDRLRNKETIRSAFDSPTFDADITVRVDKENGDVGSATISPSGRDVAIASKSGLEIIDLDSPLNPPRHLRYGQSYIVADVQWSPFAARENWVASASNQKALIWNLTMSDDSKQGAIEHTLDAHSRAITDINFSAHHPDIISTCAVDGYVHCWDLRRPRRPVMTFVDWDAGATQVKWNRQDPHILASSHDQWLRIWDDRWGGSPFKSIEAHDSKIYGLDWNRTRHDAIATCSLDKSIKFWDYTKGEDEVLERVIRTEFPVWRARHTPFGWGILAMPQDEPGQLYLFDRRRKDSGFDEAVPPVSTFEGHGDHHMVKEFLWRSRGAVSDQGIDDREFQLVSWGTDNELRLQSINAEVLDKVGYIKGDPVRPNLYVTRKGATYRTFRHLDYESGERDKETSSRPYPQDILNNSGVVTDAGKTMTLPKQARYTTSNSKIGRPVSSKRNQIGWMSGIKISKPQTDAGDLEKSRARRRLSLITPNFSDEQHWHEPESLQDEIIRVHKQYSKVSFDDVNMDTRSLTVSMNGPWGQSGDSTYVKVHVKFPPEYPELKVPTFSVDKTSLVSEIMYGKIVAEVDQIAAGFVERKRGCLEAAVCYLLGMEDLEESTLWFSEDKEIEGVDALAEESSSEEEVDQPISASAMMQESDVSVADNTLAVPARHANVPRPRSCGAVFANNGKLVCFFPPKQETVKSLLGNLRQDDDVFGDEHGFNNFARLRQDPLSSSKSKFSTVAVDDADSDSDFSDDSNSSSTSSDSGSSRFRSQLGHSTFWSRMPPGYRRGLSTRGSQKSSTIGTHTGTAFSRPRVIKPKNIVVLHDVGNIVPAKKCLAVDYAIFGDGAEVCNHNAEVAERHGHHERADIWRYAALLLQHEVPLQVLDQSHRQEPILVIARTMLRRCRDGSDSDSGIDMMFDKKPKSDKISARVKWGLNPLAKPLINDLFDHYEKRADVQMLAMLSCVFSEPSIEEGAARAEVQLNQPETPLSMKTPGFSLDYFPTDIAAWSAYNTGPYSTAASTPKALTPTAAFGSYGLGSLSYWNEPPSTSYSTGETPPLRSARGSSDKLHHQLTSMRESQSLSTSPDDKRSFRRGNTGLGATFSFSRPFSATAPSSPPNRKKPSPVDHFLGMMTPSAVTWGRDTILGSNKDRLPNSRQSLSDEDIHYQDDLKPVTGISTVMHNQDLFDDEGCVSSPLLPMVHMALFSNYRAAYAELLLSWGLQLQRLEILKFSGLPDYYSNSLRVVGRSSLGASSIISNDAKTITSNAGPPSPILLGKPELKSLDQGLDITAYCLKHDSKLSTPPYSVNDVLVGGAIGKCDKCSIIKNQLSCVICEEPVAEMYTPCLSCGCVTHQQCLHDYGLISEGGDMSCPGGCECNCFESASDGIVEGWEVMIGSIRRQNPTFDTGEMEIRGMRDEDVLLSPIDEAGGEGENGRDKITVQKNRAGSVASAFSAASGVSSMSGTMQQAMGVGLAVGHWRKRMGGGKRLGSGLREV